MLIYEGTLKESTEIHLELISNYIARLQDTRLTNRSQSVYYMPAMNRQNLKLKIPGRKGHDRE